MKSTVHFYLGDGWPLPLLQASSAKSPLPFAMTPLFLLLRRPGCFMSLRHDRLVMRKIPTEQWIEQLVSKTLVIQES
jgi:hypothetical protein